MGRGGGSPTPNIMRDPPTHTPHTPHTDTNFGTRLQAIGMHDAIHADEVVKFNAGRPESERLDPNDYELWAQCGNFDIIFGSISRFFVSPPPPRVRRVLCST